MQLKGQLRMYMRWPLIMTLLLIGMDVWMYMVDKKAGLFDVSDHNYICRNRFFAVFL